MSGYHLCIGSIKCEYTFIFHLPSKICQPSGQCAEILLKQTHFNTHSYSIFYVNILPLRSNPCDYNIPPHHLERTDNKQFTGQIKLRHVTFIQAVSYQSYNPDHNILELYNILLQIRFTISKTKLEIQYSKLGIRVPSRVAKRLKTQDLRKLENIKKFSHLGRHIAQCLVTLQEIRLC